MLEGEKNNITDNKNILPGAKTYFHNRMVLLNELVILHTYSLRYMLQVQQFHA